MAKQNVWREMFSGGSGRLSSKRVMGAVSFSIALGCIIYLVVFEGGTMITENLLQTILFMSSALLGLDSVTGIWKKRSPISPESDERKEEKK